MMNCSEFIFYAGGSMKKIKIYLDSCCFSRPFDEIINDKMRLECEAVLTIIGKCENGEWDIFESDVLDDEFDRMTNVIQKQKVLELYSSASIYIEINEEIVSRAKEFIRVANPAIWLTEVLFND